jgi:hypothetical protein
VADGDDVLVVVAVVLAVQVAVVQEADVAVVLDAGVAAVGGVLVAVVGVDVVRHSGLLSLGFRLLNSGAVRLG